jgi:hypothetical protein
MPKGVFLRPIVVGDSTLVPHYGQKAEGALEEIIEHTTAGTRGGMPVGHAAPFQEPWIAEPLP